MSEFSEGATTPAAPVEGDAAPDSTQAPASYISEMVGEGKRFKTIDEAAEALAKKAVNADKHIETLLKEKREIEEKYTAVEARNRSVDEIMAAIRGGTEDPPPAAPAASTPALTADEVLAELERRTEAKAKATAKQVAIDQTWQLLASPEVFGDIETAKLAVSKYINGDEGRKGLVNNMAISDPKGLLLVLNASREVTTFSEPEQGAQREGALPTGKLTWDIVNKVRKENPKLYNSKAFKQRMHTEL